MTEKTDYDPSLLPPVIVRYLELHDDRDQGSAVAELFAPHARVVDEGIEYGGTDAIVGWLSRTASAYTFTTRLLGQEFVRDGRWVVFARLEGDFPGGVVDLRYRIATEDDRIVDLVIAPLPRWRPHTEVEGSHRDTRTIRPQLQRSPLRSVRC